MRQKTPTINGRPIDTIPYFIASDLGEAREHIFFRNGRQVVNLPQNKATEVFCTFDSYAKENKCGVDNIRFWMKRTEKVQALFDTLFSERKYNQHIEFIEWDDRINCVVCDGIYISQTNFFMTKEEFVRFIETIIPFDEIKISYQYE
jgi:hypothetical protein